MSEEKFIFNVMETTQILWGPCKRKGSEYSRLIRMLKNGKIRSIQDGERFWITRETLVNFVGSEKNLDERLKSLYEQNILLKFKPNINKMKTQNSERKNHNKEIYNSETQIRDNDDTCLNITKSNQKTYKECQINWLKEAFNFKRPLRKDLADFMGVRPETISKYMTNKESFIKLKIENANMVFEFFGFGNYHQLWETGTITPPSSISNLNKQSNPIEMNLTKNKSISKELNLKIKDIKKSISTELDVNIDDVVINIDIPAKKLTL